MNPHIFVFEHGLIELEDLWIGCVLFFRSRLLDSCQLVQGTIHRQNNIADGLKTGIVCLSGQDAVDGSYGNAG